jgi:hypothetical protein
MGICRLYLSAVMWVLCRIRWSRAFRVPFVYWHVHYAENMPLAQRRSFNEWFFCGHFSLGDVITRAEVSHMLHSCLVPALVAVMDDNGQRFESTPSVWQLMYLCISDMRDGTFLHGSISRQLTAADRIFFPLLGYAQWARDRGRSNCRRLDVGAWVDAFGERVALRRMVQCAVFHMPRACAALLLHAIAHDGAVPAWAGNADPQAPADYDLLAAYEDFMLKHYWAVYQLGYDHLRGRRREPAAGVTLADFTACAVQMSDASAFDRVQAARDRLDGVPV